MQIEGTFQLITRSAGTGIKVARYDVSQGRRRGKLNGPSQKNTTAEYILSGRHAWEIILARRWGLRIEAVLTVL